MAGVRSLRAAGLALPSEPDGGAKPRRSLQSLTWRFARQTMSHVPSPSRRRAVITKDLADQVRSEVRPLKAALEAFLNTYKKLCVQLGGPEWGKGKIELVFHNVRSEIIPIMEQAGMEGKQVQALCSWAAKLAMED